jgi:IMP dehydrogenase
MVKAFAAGADAVMVGSMLAGTNETPGEVNEDGTKEFRGMASAGAQQSRGSGVSTVEGIETRVGARGSVSEVLNEIRLGLGSGCSYSGVSRLRDLQDAAQYITVTSASLGETKPHAMG